jgi:hypothetical protein
VKSRTVLEHIRQVERDLVGLKGGIDRLGSFACFGDLNMRHTHNTLSEKSEKIHPAAQQTPGGGDRLHGQVKHAHWNVRGPAFIAIHELFDKIADKLEDYSDTLAGREGEDMLFLVDDPQGVGHQERALRGDLYGTVRCAADRDRALHLTHG